MKASYFICICLLTMSLVVQGLEVRGGVSGDISLKKMQVTEVTFQPKLRQAWIGLDKIENSCCPCCPSPCPNCPGCGGGCPCGPKNPKETRHHHDLELKLDLQLEEDTVLLDLFSKAQIGKSSLSLKLDSSGTLTDIRFVNRRPSCGGPKPPCPLP